MFVADTAFIRLIISMDSFVPIEFRRGTEFYVTHGTPVAFGVSVCATIYRQIGFVSLVYSSMPVEVA